MICKDPTRSRPGIRITKHSVYFDVATALTRLHHQRKRTSTLNRLLWLLAALAAGCSLFNQELPNEPPRLEVSTADTLRVARGGRVSFQVSASDKDDDPLGYLWSAFGAGTFTDSASNITDWRAPEKIQGNSETFLITVTITDHRPDTEDIVENFLIEVIQRRPVLTVVADTTVSFRECQVVLGASATDEDGDPLTFEWELLEGDRVGFSVINESDGQSQVQLSSLVPTTAQVLLSLTDGSDTLVQQIQVVMEAEESPDGGTVALERQLADGTTVNFEMDVYEYPNRRGEPPLIGANWFEAFALCEEKGMRLCSSAEWKDACAGPEGLPYSSTDDPQVLPERFGLRFCNTEGSDLAGDDPQPEVVAPSGSMPNCSHPEIGVYDLTGNAFEWLMDINLFGDRVGAFQLSSVQFLAVCEEISSMAALPPAIDLDISDPAVVDSLLSLPNAELGYGQSNFGFRCCR